MKKSLLLLMISFFMVFQYGCANTAAEGGAKADYQEVKKMLVDLLKTDEGKKAVKDIITDEKVGKEILMDQAFVKKTIQETLTSKEGKAYFQQLIKDPKFSKTLAESMQKQNEKMLKSLMKDPDYQTMMMDILKSPEMEKQFLELMQSKTYREQMQKVLGDTFQSPLFKAEIAEMLKKVAEEEMKKSDNEQSGQGQDGQGQGQGQGQDGQQSS